MSGEEWFDGKEGEPFRMSLKPEGSIIYCIVEQKQNRGNTRISFAPIGIQNNDENDRLVIENEDLKNKVKQLEEQNQKLNKV